MKTLLLMLSLCALGDVFALMKVTGGSVVALVTPMTRSNNVDIKKLTDLLEWHVEQGTAGAVILGTTGGKQRNNAIKPHSASIYSIHWISMLIPLDPIRGEHHHSTGKRRDYQGSCGVSWWEDAYHSWYRHH